MPDPCDAAATLSDTDFQHLANYLLALEAGRLPPPVPAHLQGHPVVQLAAAGQLDPAVVALMGDVHNPWLGLMRR
ncbi:hypothetical protein KQ945_05990 [Bacillus subtilis subsp. subtilis]|nr:hypothetical protein [Bacillus subtilis subsp. subtilis]